MLMDSLEEVMDTQLIIKGKRTKRQIPPSPLTLTTASSSSCFADAGGGRIVSDDFDEFAESAQEEEKDMANCLILLAQGRRHRQKLPSEAMASTAGYVFQCNTCSRCFPSFQALGGHRASHKKPKPLNVEDEKKLPSLMEEEDDRQFNKTSTTRVLCSTNTKSKVHKCSVCGAEFASGQALGGHMRRHRAFMSRDASTTMFSLSSSSGDQSQEAEKPRNAVQLDIDLNLPAPEDDLSESKLFSFKSKEQVIVFSESSLVDCL